MQQVGWNPSKYGLEHHGIENVNAVYWNLSSAALYEQIVLRHEGLVAHRGPIVVRTGHHTGRAPNDKFIVKEPSSQDRIWWGEVNQPFDEEKFDTLYYRLLAYLQGKELFVQDCYAGADTRYRVRIRVITEDAWHSLFARNMFVRPDWDTEASDHVPEFTVLNVPHFHALPELDGTNSSAFIIVHFGKKLIIIGGTSYAGEIKKSIFTILNYLLPLDQVLPMHCSANMGRNGDVAIFFGLSGTGKTTLSTDSERRMIGDDEHGWSDEGIFNFEGGCYAKVIRLSKESEPEIYKAVRMFGVILENVTIDSVTRRFDFDDNTLTENTRAAYPITHLDNAIYPGIAGHPQNVIMLTCDAFGVLPPIAKLSPEQAVYHFLSGYTAKVAGTEKGLGSEPQATFSPCFGAPFMALHPTVYARLLGEKISRHNVNCWLINTGWTGGPHGVGNRISIAYTRSLVRAALDGHLDDVSYVREPFFGLLIPEQCPDVPAEILNPINTWPDKELYKTLARDLASKFHQNFTIFSDNIGKKIVQAGPGPF
nr:phosphoenolpyruvate carboxykinase (ATP) [Desulfobacterales bacterium]